MGKINAVLSALRNGGITEAFGLLRRRLNASERVQGRRAARLARASMSPALLKEQRNYKFNKNTVISILLPVFNTDIGMLGCVIESVISQTYPCWELCICDGSDGEHAYVGERCGEYAASDSRIKYFRLEKNGGIAANTNRCAGLASGEYMALLDHDDALHPSALFKAAREIEETGADFIYTDELTFSGKKVLLTNFKPDYSPDTLRGNNYICHFTVFSKELYGKSGGFRSEYDGSQDHDFFLRMTADAKRVRHIPEPLYFWRAHEGSVVGGVEAKSYAVDAGIRAVRDNLAEWGQPAEVFSSEVYPTVYRIKYILKDEPRVSVIIPSADAALSEECRASLSITDYGNYEIIQAGSESGELNECVRSRANGSCIVLLDGRAGALKPGWLGELVRYAARGDVGAAGTGLMRPDGTVDSYFMITGAGRDGTAVPAGRGLKAGDNGYLGRMGFCQNVNALNSACLAVSRDKYLRAGGLDERLSVTYNRIDICLKLRQMGYNNVYTPFAAFSLLGKPSRDAAAPEEKAYFLKKWDGALADPYYNVNFKGDGSYLL